MTLIFLALLGAAVGSFLNLCIDRLPRRQSLVRPPSRCDSCDTRLGWGGAVSHHKLSGPAGPLPDLPRGDPQADSSGGIPDRHGLCDLGLPLRTESRGCDILLLPGGFHCHILRGPGTQNRPKPGCIPGGGGGPYHLLFPARYGSRPRHPGWSLGVRGDVSPLPGGPGHWAEAT